MSPKPSQVNITVAQVLKSTRVAQKLSLQEVEKATRIRGKYLLALESGSHADLPHNVYARGFVQTYAEYLDLDAPELAERFIIERGEQVQQFQPDRPLKASRLTLTPRLVTLVSALALGVAAAGYLVYQFSALTAAPRLEITNPNKDQVLYGSLITISGMVAGGADVFVNDSPILVDGSGKYTDSIALQDGINTITVSARNRLGKTSVVSRNILAHVPKADPSTVLPSAPFDGVAVAVRVQSKAATVTVIIDGKQAFKGTMLPGTQQVFKGMTNVNISTTDGGATSLTVSNATNAGQDLGAIGKDGQAKAGFQFDKDTQFQ